jgi:hypothetical protein
MDEGRLLSALLAADTLDDVRGLLDEYATSQAAWITWRPVGDRRNNSGTIQAAGDPARSLMERVTNGIDAVIERAHFEHHGTPECSTPREAAETWFGVPAPGLHKLTASQRRKLAQNTLWLTLSPGDGRAKRTVTVADKGTGLSPDQMPHTILSLNAENKIDKFYLAGAFGQGGSATFASSDYTLIASRSVKSPNVIGFTVVKLEPPQGIKLGSYVYLVREQQVLTTTELPEEMKDFSTVVKHFGYDLDDYPSPLGQNSVYGRAQSTLFEPVLPFWLDNKIHGWGRTIKGSRTALNGAKDEGDEDSKLTWSNPLFFSDLGEWGRIGIEYWVLEPGEKTAPNKAFVSGTRPIVLTVNGQTHAEWAASILRKDASLMHLASRMVVHLDCNQLSFDAKRVLFVSNREESRKGLVQNMILQELLAALKSDEKLDELEEQARMAGMKERDESAEKEIRKEVAKMLRVFGFAAAEEAGAVKPTSKGERATGGTKKGKTKPEPIQINEPPSFVELVGDGPITFFPGQRRYVRVRTDAHSKYHDSADPLKSRFSFLVGGNEVQFKGTTELRDGHMRAIFAADTEARLGAKGDMTVELRRPNDTTLSHTTAFEIIAPPPAKAGSAKLNLPNIDIQPVSDPASQEWIALAWSSDTNDVAADYWYEAQGDTLRVRYSTAFPRYKNARDTLRTRDVASATSFEKRYEIWLITNVLIHWQDTKEDPTPMGGASLAQEEMDDFRRDEMRRTSKACVIYAQREAALGIAVSADET